MSYKVGSKQLIKRINQISIFKVIRDEGLISRADIAKKLKLTSATVSSNTNDLIEEGLIQEIGIGQSNGGRRPVLLTVDREKTVIVGVDVHKGSVSCGLVNLLGEVLFECEATFSDKESKYERDILLCVQIALEHKKDRKVLGIGVGMCGVVDSDKCISLFVPSQPLVGVDLRSYLSEKTGYKVCLDNDANAMAIGEKWYGVAKNANNYVFLNVGQGIGSGVIINNEIYRGSGFAAGEIGHICVEENGKRCVCGKYGCLDTVATENSLIEQIRIGFEEGKCKKIFDSIEDINSNSIYIAALERNSYVLEVLENVGKHIGKTISYVINFMNPKCVILGGSMVKFSDFILESLKKEAVRLSMNECVRDVEFTVSNLGDHAGIIGAATLVIEYLIGY